MIVPTLWARIGARFFDELVMALPRLALTLPYTTFDADAGVRYDPPRWVLAASVLVPLLYDFVFVRLMSATPGKFVFGLRVVGYAGLGRVGSSQAALRALVPIIGSALALATTSAELGALLALVTPVIYASVSWSPLRRGLHDRAAGTIVVLTD